MDTFGNIDIVITVVFTIKSVLEQKIGKQNLEKGIKMKEQSIERDYGLKRVFLRVRRASIF